MQGCVLLGRGRGRERSGPAGTCASKHHGEDQRLLQCHLGHHLDQTPRGPLQHHLPGCHPGTATSGGHHTPLHLLPLLLEPARQEWPARAKQREEEEEEGRRRPLDLCSAQASPDGEEAIAARLVRRKQVAPSGTQLPSNYTQRGEP